MSRSSSQARGSAKAQAKSSSAAPTQKLIPTTLFIRIRPMAAEGGHMKGEEGAHKLKGWTEQSVTMQDSARRLQEFKYPTKVIVPDMIQQDMYDCMMPSLVDKWINHSTNVMMLAYGQTGTGKSHTMLGSQESLRAQEVHPDWGILPRVAHSCFGAMEADKGGVSYILTASAADFYLGMCCDLMNNHIPLEVDSVGTPLGLHRRVLQSMSDFYIFLEDLKRNRVTAATKMNTESSRSHCAILLCLFRLEHQTQMFSMSKFNLFDLAGSERADKTGERANPNDVFKTFIQLGKGEVDPRSVSVAVQGWFINYELTALATEICKATDQYRAGRKYNPPTSKTMSTAFQRYAGEVLTGHSLLNTIICMSPAPQNGSENIFSLKWGQNVAKLKAPITVQNPISVDKALKIACEDVEQTAAELQKRDKQNKFYSAYLSRAEMAAQKKTFLEKLMASA